MFCRGCGCSPQLLWKLSQTLKLTPGPWVLSVWPSSFLGASWPRGCTDTFVYLWSSRSKRIVRKCWILGLHLGLHLPVAIVLFPYLLELSRSQHGCHSGSLSPFHIEGGLSSIAGSTSLQFLAHVFSPLPVEVANLMCGVHVSTQVEKYPPPHF